MKNKPKYQEPLVSVIIPNRDGEAYIEDCLESIEKQTYQNLETIIVDDQSSDRSVSIVRKSFPRARIIELNKHTYPAGALNVGINASRGEIIAVLNNDALAHPEWIEQGIKGFSSDPGSGMVASQILDADRNYHVQSAGDGIGRDGRPYNLHSSGYENSTSQARAVLSACGTGALYRREMIKEVGGFDGDFMAYFEDVDLGLRAWLHGYKCIYIPGAKVFHIGGGAGMKEEEKVFLAARNKLYLWTKDLPLPFILANLPWMSVGLIKSLTYHLLISGQIRAFLKGTTKGFLDIPYFLKKRRLIQKRKTIKTSEILSLSAE